MDHALLQQEISTISTQLNTLISMFQSGTTLISSNTSPVCGSKRPNLNHTPVKPVNLNEIFTQEPSVTSAASNPEEEMEGCEL